MVALYQISTNTIIQNYGNNIPTYITVPGIGDVQAPNSTWSNGDYKFIPVTYILNPNNQFSVFQNTTQAVSNGQLFVTVNYIEPSLAQVQGYLNNLIENTAENLREKYMIDSTVWQSLYVFRYLEAINIQANAAPVANNYPLNNALVGVGAIANITQAAAFTIQQFNTWMPTASQIENIRLTGRSNINNANSIPNAISVYHTVAWGNL
jgi:hypothetical protein